MLSRRNWWLASLLCAFAAAAILVGLHFYRHRFVRSNEDLLRLLPENDATVFFANIAALRQSGYLSLLEGAKRKQDIDYLAFVRQTGFDYTKDLDSLCGAAIGREVFFALRGRFDWSKLRDYVQAHGGNCDGGLCSIATSEPGRMASLRSIQPDVIGLAIGPDRAAAESIRPSNGSAALPSSAPVWVRPSQALLSNPTQLPLAVRIFAISLESANSVLLELRPSSASNTAFMIGIDAVFRNSSMAETAEKQIELNTDTLKKELAREHQRAAPADLAWLLTAGTFQLTNEHLLGTWPVRRELLSSLR